MSNMNHDKAVKRFSTEQFRQYNDGVLGKIERAKRFERYRNAAKRGDAQAQLHLGWCYAKGKGTRQDYAKAVSSVWSALMTFISAPICMRCRTGCCSEAEFILFLAKASVTASCWLAFVPSHTELAMKSVLTRPGFTQLAPAKSFRGIIGACRRMRVLEMRSRRKCQSQSPSPR